MKAKKKPVEIDYFEMTQSTTPTDLQIWLDEFGDVFSDKFVQESNALIAVKTLEGTSYVINSTQMIIRGVEGEYYPCRKDIFENTYDKQ